MVGKVGAYQGQKIFENPREALTHAQVTSHVIFHAKYMRVQGGDSNS
jgi:hypothetical protein